MLMTEQQSEQSLLLLLMMITMMTVQVARQLTRAPRMKKTMKKRPIGVSQAMSP